MSILEEHADEDDAEREVQEEEGDEADQAIPENEQPTKGCSHCGWHTETYRRVICKRPGTLLDLTQFEIEGSRIS